ncbi:MAG: sigma-70 family RNA polymerase sigma factor [Bacteroidetes bacterium]|nr:sigma-70 family RNA polymerase sigma factor [Bacteroidota bacterium]MBS1973208.1 sigma-70 family RNA polymerase sigma factor [Bacteroidota bacterium]
MDEMLAIKPAMSGPSRKNISSLVSQFGKRLFGFIRRRVSNEADAEDILQDVWYQLTATIDAEPIEQVSSWLFTVARNKIIDSYRKKKPGLIEDGLIYENEEGEISLKEILLADTSNPERAYLRDLFWKVLQEALEELPEEQRDVFIWNELEDIPFKEISRRTGTQVNTLISRKRYAVLHLRKRLQTLHNDIINY